jgi:predicted kinase
MAMAVDGRPVAILVAGPPACGKSTVGAALARTLGAALIDQDTVTAPLVRVVGSLVKVHDLDDPRLATLTRAPRYDSIRGIAEDNLRVGNTAVLVAPFTLERHDLDAYQELTGRLRAAGGRAVALVWLHVEREQLVHRLRARAADRDTAKLHNEGRFVDRLDLTPPVVPHLAIDAAGPVDRIVRSIVRGLEPRIGLAIDGRAR